MNYRKYLLISLVAFFTFAGAFAQSQVKTGMTMNEFLKIYPNLEMSKYENTTTFTRAEDIFGINGTWGYRFENEKLTWIYYSKYIDDINEADFKKCLSATKKVIKNYSQLYGRPDTTITGKTIFVNPRIKRHWGYNVIEARWKDHEGMKVKAGFNFMGGKGEYHFIITINYFDKDYPYYD